MKAIEHSNRIFFSVDGGCRTRNHHSLGLNNTVGLFRLLRSLGCTSLLRQASCKASYQGIRFIVRLIVLVVCISRTFFQANSISMKHVSRQAIEDKVNHVVAIVLAVLLFPFVCLGICLWWSICYLWSKCTGRDCDFAFRGCGTSIVQQRIHKNRERRCLEETPNFLGPRDRAFTLPFRGKISDSLPAEQRNDCQSQSLFFAHLPLEIREVIYCYVLSSFLHIHIYRRQDKRLGHYKCHKAHRYDESLLHRGSFCGEAGSRHPALTPTNAWIPGRWNDNQIRELLPLFKACRRM